ncbi:MAG TPA: 3-phosphoshikimate 1-carboxyvinyltransferase [Elusimicrobiota bacterium]|nr:3-phosphoshikimate 1-carboxyvinyltransferase [Elusimicrobiota bacterium]
MTVSTSSRIVVPGGSLRGETLPPPDKSITHRAIILSALSTGTSRIIHPLAADDCERTAEAFRSLGISVERDRTGAWVVVGRGLYGLNEAPSQTIYCGNSGTTMRLVSGVLAGQPFETKLMGDHSLSNRPMDRVAQPLRAMGAEIAARDGKYAPLHIHGRRPLTPVDWKSPVPSAQVKSCVLLAGLYTEGITSVEETFKSRDHTERMFSAAGIKLDIQGNRVAVRGGQTLTAQEWVVPSDISSAAFPLVAALIAPGSEILLRNVDVNPTRDGLLEVLQAMGANIKREDIRVMGGEPVCDLVVKTSGLKATRVDEEIIPRLLDEIPILTVAATQAEGVTEIRGAAELRVKESDRLAHVTSELTKMGARIQELPDGLIIRGPTPLRGAEVDSFNDHRMAMAFAVAGLIADGNTSIRNADCVDISFPTFWEEFEKLRVATT